MKNNFWLILGVLVATGARAQTSTNALPPIPAPLISPQAESMPAPTLRTADEPKTNAPAKSVKKSAPKAKHKAHKTASMKPAEKISSSEPTVALIPGPAEVAVKNLNVRGQAGLKGEFITHVNEGETVQVLGQITLDKPKSGEPAQWAKISLPTNAAVWINSRFIDSTNNTVSSKKLNLRAGPSENYSVLGVLERGTFVTPVITKGDWTQIEPPSNAYAFVAAMYLKQEASGAMATNLPPSAETAVGMTNEIPMTTNTLSEPQPIMNEAPTNLPTPRENVTPEPEMNVAPPPPQIVTNILVVVETNLPPPPPRIVTHEGVVRPSVSPVAPTVYELYDPATSVAIDYLYTTTTNLDVARYNGFRIVVTGEEGLDSRWKDTPLLTIQRIYVVSGKAKNSRGRDDH
jgi:uncharacterized protein YgiM (DUF1202 family)